MERQSEEKSERKDVKTEAKGVAPRKAFRVLRKRPGVVAVAAGAVGLVAANMIGVGELAIAMAAAYGAYRVLTT